jgi:hypothetical protein
VTQNEIEENGLIWYFGAGLGLSVIIMATIGLLHKLLEEHKNSTRLCNRRRIILATRFVAGILMVLLPLAREEIGTTLRYMGIYVGILAFLIIEEMMTRLEKAGQPLDDD